VRLLVIDSEGSSGLDLALRAKQAGHEVKFFVRRTERNKLVGRGFVEVVDDFRPWLRWSNLVVSCLNDFYISALDLHRRDGGLVIAPSVETAAWETDRQKGQAVLRKAGISVIPSTEFSDYDRAISFVKKQMKRYVSKPTGDGTADKALSYVSSGPDDMVFMLERWKRLNKLKTPFILQEFVAGIEMSAAGWFGPGGWNEGWEEAWEHKKFMNDDLGPATGEQGTVMRYTRNSKLARKVLLPLTEQLEKASYVGDIAVNCIVDERGNPWPLEFTTRLGWPAFNLQCALYDGDHAQWLHDLSIGKDSRGLILDRVCAGVVMSIPDYPYSHLTRKEVVGIPIYGATRESLWKHVHPCEMQMCDAPVQVEDRILSLPQPCTAGDYVLVMTAVSETVRDAALICYRRLERLKVPNSPMYRTDVGKRLAKQLPVLQKLGYATGLAYSPTS
jgi:phosphoribosylamine--glycine ligase